MRAHNKKRRNSLRRVHNQGHRVLPATEIQGMVETLTVLITTDRAKRFITINPDAHAIAAPTMPKEGTRRRPRQMLHSTDKVDIHCIRRSNPVISNNAPTDPAETLTSCPRDRITSAVAPLLNSSPNTLNRHFPANLQIHGNRIYIAPPRELHSLRSPPMTRLWRADHVRKAIWQRFPPSRHTSPVFSTLPSISSAYAGTGLRRRSSIKAKIFWNKIFYTATSASWNVT